MSSNICTAESVQDQDNESWRIIPDYPNYEASRFGDVRNTKTGRVLKPVDNGLGYMIVRLHKDGQHKNFLVHRLVMIAFNGPIPNGYEVDHCDHDRTNNRLTNLRYVTHSENQRNKSCHKGVSYDFVDALPADSVCVTEYCKHKFERVYYVPSTGNFYFDTLTHSIRVMHTSVHHNSKRISATDVEGKFRWINIAKWKSANNF